MSKREEEALEVIIISWTGRCFSRKRVVREKREEEASFTRKRERTTNTTGKSNTSR
jgi:hypothetical protein